jgi:hypothetical protein
MFSRTFLLNSIFIRDSISSAEELEIELTIAQRVDSGTSPQELIENWSREGPISSDLQWVSGGNLAQLVA